MAALDDAWAGFDAGGNLGGGLLDLFKNAQPYMTNVGTGDNIDLQESNFHKFYSPDGRWVINNIDPTQNSGATGFEVRGINGNKNWGDKGVGLFDTSGNFTGTRQATGGHHLANFLTALGGAVGIGALGAGIAGAAGAAGGGGGGSLAAGAGLTQPATSAFGSIGGLSGGTGGASFGLGSSAGSAFGLGEAAAAGAGAGAAGGLGSTFGQGLGQWGAGSLGTGFDLAPMIDFGGGTSLSGGSGLLNGALGGSSGMPGYGFVPSGAFDAAGFGGIPQVGTDFGGNWFNPTGGVSYGLNSAPTFGGEAIGSGMSFDASSGTLGDLMKNLKLSGKDAVSAAKALIDNNSGKKNMDLSTLAPYLFGANGDYQQNKAGGQMRDWINGQQAKIDSLYNPGSAEYNALWQEMSRKDAAAGRNSQTGPRSVDLAARIAQIKADNTRALTTGVSRAYADALNQQATGRSLPGLAAATGAGSLGGVSRMGLDQLTRLLGGLGGGAGSLGASFGQDVGQWPTTGLGNTPYDFTPNDDLWNSILGSF